MAMLVYRSVSPIKNGCFSIVICLLFVSGWVFGFLGAAQPLELERRVACVRNLGMAIGGH